MHTTVSSVANYYTVSTTIGLYLSTCLVVYWTKIDTFWPLSHRESFIILGSQIVPDNNHVVPCHVIICSGQSRRYCVKLEKVDNIGSTNLIITRGSRLKQKENKWWAVFSVFQASASRLCLGSLFGFYARGFCLGSLLGVSSWGLCLGCLLGSLLLDLSLGLCFWISAFKSLIQVSVLGLWFGSLFFCPTSPLLVSSMIRSHLHWVSPVGLMLVSLLWVSVSDLCIGLPI